MNSRRGKLFLNAQFVCMDRSDCHAQAVLTAGDSIVAVGQPGELREFWRGELEECDLGGAVVYPGFIDTHSHLDLLAAWAQHAYLGGAESLEEALQILHRHGQEHPDLPIVMGYGFDDTAISEMRGPGIAELDAMFGERPAFITHISIHAAYANSAMLRLMGIDPGRDPGNLHVACTHGRPTGLLTEGMAMQALAQLPPMTPDIYRQGLLAAIAAYNAQGFTSCIGGGLGLGGLDGSLTLRMLGGLELEGRLDLRCHLPIISGDYQAAWTCGLLSGPGSAFVRPHGLKLLTDGAIQSRTAALEDGYFDDPALRPEPIISQEMMNELVLAAHSEGQQIVAHGNGSGAIERAIIALERAQRICPRKNPRHLLVHCQTASESQLERMQAAGFEPTFYVLHIWNWGDRHVRHFLGPERAARLDPCASAVALGLPFSMHADTPVLPQMTMLSIHTAVNRQTRSGLVLGPEQRISPLEAMRAYTTYAAGMCLDSARRGSIEPGKLADFTLLSADPRQVDPERIKDIAILGCIVGARRAGRESGA